MSQYVVVDFEMCKVTEPKYKAEFGLRNELIQIGATLLDESFEIVDSFMSYVHPQYGEVDPFITKLTGITNQDVADAPIAKDALELFANWMPEDVRLVSWSMSDFHQLQKEIQVKQLALTQFDPYYETWIDCQEMFREKVHGDRCYNLTEALNRAGIYYYDGEHDGLIDAKNTAMLFAKMQKEPVFKLSPYLADETKEPLSSSLGSLLKGLKLS